MKQNAINKLCFNLKWPYVYTCAGLRRRVHSCDHYLKKKIKNIFYRNIVYFKNSYNNAKIKLRIGQVYAMYEMTDEKTSSKQFL